jgi:hypothetical protein
MADRRTLHFCDDFPTSATIDARSRPASVILFSYDGGERVMSVYAVFGWLTAFTTTLGAVAGVMFFLSPGNRTIVRVLFFVVPASALFRLLSRPLSEQSPYRVWSYVAVVCISLLAGAKQVGRRSSGRSTSPASLITRGSDEALPSTGKSETPASAS